MREAGNDDALEVGEDDVEWLALLGRARGKRRADVSGFDPRKNGVAIRSLEVIGYPVGEAMRLPPELVLTTDLGAPP